MNCAVLLLPLLLSLQDETETVRQELLAGVAQGNPQVIEKAVERLLPLPPARSPAILVEAYERAVQTLKELDKERVKWEKHVEEHRERWEGKVFKGNTIEHIRGRDNLAATNARIAALQLWYPRLLAALSRLPQGADLVPLLQRNDWYVRAHAVAALARSAPKELLALAEREKEPGVRVALADALARAEGRTLLESWLQDASWPVRVATARALGAVRDRRSAGPLIAALRGADGRVRQEINEALKAVTGVDKHGVWDAWNEWWTLNREAFLAGTYAPKASERAEDKGGSTFYGVRVHSTKILFILDVSSSMLEKAQWMPGNGADRPKGDRCLDVAQFELKQILRALPATTDFNILLLHRESTLLFEKAGRGRGSIDKAAKFIDGVQILDGTDIFASLRRGYGLSGGTEPNSPVSGAGFDTIYVISDGVASSGILDTALMVERLAELNRFRRIAVHGIGVSPPYHGEDLLRQLAAATGGSYVRR